MSRLFWLTDEQWSKIEPLLPHYGSPPRVDDRRILSGIIHVLRCGCRWWDCPAEYGPIYDSLQSVQPVVSEGHLAEHLRTV